MWHHLLLKEAPDAVPEKVMVLVEDPAGPDVHHGLGTGGLWTDGGGGLPVLLGLAVLQPGKEYKHFTNQSINHEFGNLWH